MRVRTLRRIAVVAFSTFAFSAVAQATPITYVVNFSVEEGTLPASGQFTYDAAAQDFSNFLVSWDGFLFDLTSEANAPSFDGVPCAGESASSSSIGFAEMSQTLPCAGTDYSWAGSVIGLTPSFDFFAGGPAREWQIFEDLVLAGPPGLVVASGNWTISEADPPSTVPEPASMLLLGTGLIGAGARRWRTRRQRG